MQVTAKDPKSLSVKKTTFEERKRKKKRKKRKGRRRRMKKARSMGKGVKIMTSSNVPSTRASEGLRRLNSRARVPTRNGRSGRQYRAETDDFILSTTFSLTSSKELSTTTQSTTASF